MKIYVAGPFFNNEEIKTLDLVVEILKAQFVNAEFYIPKEHKIEGGETMPNVEWAKKVRDMDLEAIKTCDVIIALYGGHYSDTGTAFEIGYASALGKEVYIINRDIHTSLMVTSSGKNLWHSEENRVISELNEKQINLLINQK